MSKVGGLRQLPSQGSDVRDSEYRSKSIHHNSLMGYSQVGKAPDFDSGNPRFESECPFHITVAELVMRAVATRNTSVRVRSVIPLHNYGDNDDCGDSVICFDLLCS